MSRRSDAARNRARPVDAAAEMFHEAGAAAPLELVTVRAGVVRGAQDGTRLLDDVERRTRTLRGLGGTRAH